MKTTRTRTLTIATGAAVIAVLAGCSVPSQPPAHSASTYTPATAAAPMPANPVPIVALTGANPAPGAKYGNVGVEDDQTADGTFPDGEQVWVFTYDTAAHRTYWLNHPVMGKQDGETDILGPANSIIIVTSATLTDPGGPSPQEIAARVHGTVLP